MQGDRLRVSVDDPYVHALGLATFCFAALEWNAVWCCEKLHAGYVSTTAGKTAGQIASDLVRLAKTHSDPSIVASLGAAAAEFARLVKRRNDLVHAKPGTAPNGDQRLFRHGSQWTIDAVNELADEFVAGSLPLNDHFHHRL